MTETPEEKVRRLQAELTEATTRNQADYDRWADSWRERLRALDRLTTAIEETRP